MKHFLIFVVSVVIPHTYGSSLASSPPRGSLQPGTTNPKVKGDTGEDLYHIPTRRLPSQGQVIWADGKVPLPLEIHRRKGDQAVLDPRGTVRYNMMQNGRIARGVITSPQDDDTPISQATGNPNK